MKSGKNKWVFSFWNQNSLERLLDGTVSTVIRRKEEEY